MEISRTALVLHSAKNMYDLVHDVASYPQFLNWCTGARILEQTPELQLACLEISIAGWRQDFTTRNRLQAGERLCLSLVDGPFQHLAGEWNFQPLGDMGCKISLQLEFDFSGGLLNSAFRQGFAHVADRLVQDFSLRADRIYGV